MSVVKLEDRKALTAENLGIRLFRRQGFMGRKSFSHWALRHVSFDVMRGEIFGVIGRNGAGKSSLLRVMANIITPDEGVLRRHGLHAQLLGLKSGFMPGLTGRENAVLSAMLAGRSRAEAESMLDDVREFSELGRWFDLPVSSYSSGMVARLGFSVSAHTRADILLIDEALSVGDRDFQQKSRAKMKDLLSSGRTVVLVSHNPGAIEDMTTRSIWLEKGRCIMQGDSKIVAAAYARFNDYLEKNRASAALEKLAPDALAYALEAAPAHSAL